MARLSSAQARCRAHRMSLGVALVVLLGAGGLLPVRAGAQQPASITVSAAISVKDALDQVGRTYEQSHPRAKILFNYAGSGTLQHQIEQGAPVDIFFSAAEKQMDSLQSKGLIVAATRTNIVANDLVLIVPANSSLVRNFQDLARPDVRIVALGEPETVPAGMYARQALDHLGLLAAVEKKTVYAKDVRQVLTYVETGNADAGIVYRTDARITAKVRIVATAPAASHDPIIYPAAVVKNAKNIGSARAFLEFLAGPEARAVFATYGFTVPEK
ncbi:MAG TPA: molybdate ABC transporter substrate-binding protein [Candidatus Polarisedimenticolia bacterium]|nr:molybdate ABC transporter substrate-binding protein [Candidatus Polarisedimenticolia bacterium]